MTIHVEIKSVYGVEKIYPIDTNAKIFAELVNQKTLTFEDVTLIKKLGYEVIVVSQYGSKL